MVKIVTAPSMEQEMIEIGMDYPSRWQQFWYGCDAKPARTIRVPGRMNFTRGYLTVEPGDNLKLGEKLKEPVKCDITGAMLYGLIPLGQCDLTGRVEFCIDYMKFETSTPQRDYNEA